MSEAATIDALLGGLRTGNRRVLSQALSLIESTHPEDRKRSADLLERIAQDPSPETRRICFTGSPGVGKSTLLETFGMELINRGHRVAVLAIDPSSRRTGGSILGDKVRMQHLAVHDNAFVRPSPSGTSLGGATAATRDAIAVCEAAGFDTIIIETVGVGQSEIAAADLVDLFILLVLPTAGDDVQGIKRGIMEVADAVVVTKSDLDLSQAELARAMYRATLQLLQPSSPNWESSVDMVSAVTSDGLAELLTTVDRFFAPDRQPMIKQRRSDQRVHGIRFATSVPVGRSCGAAFGPRQPHHQSTSPRQIGTTTGIGGRAASTQSYHYSRLGAHMSFDLSTLQAAVKDSAADAWVLYDFRGMNDLAWTIADLPSDAHCTRRWVLVIPEKGHAVKIVHKLERHVLDHVKADERAYATHEEYDRVLRETLAPFKTVAMEYSPMNAIPVASKVDAGTIEHVRSIGCEVVSSADVAQRFTSVLSASQIAGASVTGGRLRDIMMDTFGFIRERLLDDETVTEYEAQQYLMERLREDELVTDSAPIVAIGRNAANPHYAPTITRSDQIQRDQVVLIDAWAKNDAPGSVYADLTWVGYTGVEIPTDVDRTFDIILKARDAALQLVQERFASGTPVAGFEVDRAARSVIDAAGLGSNFIHRTGHSITTETHGAGANMDDFETHDTRTVLPGSSFSIEPGVYFEDSLGLRTEIDVIVQPDGSIDVPSNPMQTGILPLLVDEWRP